MPAINDHARYEAPPTAFHTTCAISGSPVLGTAIENTSDKMGANDTAPARAPHDMVIIATKAIAATPTPSAIGYGLRTATTSAATRLKAAAAATRCNVRDSVFGTSAQLAH